MSKRARLMGAWIFWGLIVAALVLTGAWIGSGQAQIPAAPQTDAAKLDACQIQLIAIRKDKGLLEYNGAVWEEQARALAKQIEALKAEGAAGKAPVEKK